MLDLIDHTLEDNRTHQAIRIRVEARLQTLANEREPFDNSFYMANKRCMEAFFGFAHDALLARSSSNRAVKSLDPLRLQSLVKRRLGINLAGSIDESREYPVGIPKKRGIRRPMNVGLHRPSCRYGACRR